MPVPDIKAVLHCSHPLSVGMSLRRYQSLYEIQNSVEVNVCSLIQFTVLLFLLTKREAGINTYGDYQELSLVCEGWDVCVG